MCAVKISWYFAEFYFVLSVLLDANSALTSIYSLSSPTLFQIPTVVGIFMTEGIHHRLSDTHFVLEYALAE